MLKTKILQIYNLEQELDLFAKSIQWVFFWELIRFNIISKILRDIKIIDNKSTKKFWKGILKGFIRWFVKPPRVIPNSKILFVKSPRKISISNGYKDIYTDYIIDYIKDSIHITVWDIQYLEDHYILGHNYDAVLDPLFVLANIQKKFRLISLSIKEEELIWYINKKINHIFDISIDIKPIVIEAIKKFLFYKTIFSVLLRKTDLKVVVSVNKNQLYNQALYSVAKDKGIITIELQHGVITKYHRWYYIPRTLRLHYNPDYIFTWGNYWNQFINIKNTKAIATGFPHFEILKKFSSKEVGLWRNNVLVINQPIFGDKLLKKVIDISKSLYQYKFLFKIHPSEKKEMYINILQKLWIHNIEIIWDELDIYDLFSISDFQLGVCSTALYEGLWYGLTTLIIDFPCSEYLEDLVKQSIVHKVKDIEEIKSILAKWPVGSKYFDKEAFFKSNSLYNFGFEISKLLWNTLDF